MSLSIDEINNRIKNEKCNNTIDELKDTNLINEYLKCNSVKNNILILKKSISKYIDDENIIQKIIEDYIPNLIPPGTKGVIKGNKFNNIVKKYIMNLNLDLDRFEIDFEKKCKNNITSEIPDWYIIEKSSNKIIIGMNQLDLWGGGHQLNRGSKYIENNKHNNENSKLLCVICNDIFIKSKGSIFFKVNDEFELY